MTAQAAKSIFSQWLAHVYYWVGYVGAMAAFILLAAVVFMPLGHVIFDYWTPKVQSIWQPASPAVKVTRGSR